MKITPLDIQQKQFQRLWRGFNPEEVHTFLDMVRSEMEALIRENSYLKEALKKADAALEDYREREKALKDTLVTAQRMSDEIKSGALKEAEIVLSEARLQGEQVVLNAHTRLTQVQEELQDLKSQRAQLIASLHASIETHAKLLEITEKQSERRDQADEKMSFLKLPRAQGQAERGR